MSDGQDDNWVERRKEMERRQAAAGGMMSRVLLIVAWFKGLYGVDGTREAVGQSVREQRIGLKERLVAFCASIRYTVNLFSNPIFVKQTRVRLRLRLAIAWGLLYLMFVGFVYLMAYFLVDKLSAFGDINPSRAAFFALFVLQCVILMGFGTHAVAWGIAYERSKGLIDYQRMTPMSPVSKIVGYMFGLPVREYFLFLLTLPFVLYSMVQGEIAFVDLVRLYSVFFASVWVYHLTGIVVGMVAEKPWRAAMAAPSIVFTLYVMLPFLSVAGVDFLDYMTVRPAMKVYIADYLPGIATSIDTMKLFGGGDYFGEATFVDVGHVMFYEAEISSTWFSLLLQGGLLTVLLIIVYRKWVDDDNLPFSKWLSVMFFGFVQFLILGGYWQFFTDAEMVRAKCMKWEGLSKDSNLFAGFSGEAALFIMLMITYLFVSMTMHLMMIFVSSPCKFLYARGIRYARKKGLHYVPMFSDGSSSFGFGMVNLAVVAFVYFKMVSMAQLSGMYFGNDMGVSTGSAIALYLPLVGFVLIGLYTQAFGEIIGHRPFSFMLCFFWVGPLFYYALSGIANNLISEHSVTVGSFSPIVGGAYAVTGMFEKEVEELKQHLPLFIDESLWVTLGVSGVLAVGSVVWLFIRQSRIREVEYERPLGSYDDPLPALIGGGSINIDKPKNRK